MTAWKAIGRVGVTPYRACQFVRPLRLLIQWLAISALVLAFRISDPTDKLEAA